MNSSVIGTNNSNYAQEIPAHSRVTSAMPIIACKSRCVRTIRSRDWMWKTWFLNYGRLQMLKSYRESKSHATFAAPKVKIRTKSGMYEQIRLLMGVTCNNFNWVKTDAFTNSSARCTGYRSDHAIFYFSCSFILIEIELRRLRRNDQNRMAWSNSVASVCCVPISISKLDLILIPIHKSLRIEMSLPCS